MWEGPLCLGLKRNFDRLRGNVATITIGEKGRKCNKEKVWIVLITVKIVGDDRWRVDTMIVRAIISQNSIIWKIVAGRN